MTKYNLHLFNMVLSIIILLMLGYLVYTGGALFTESRNHNIGRVLMLGLAIILIVRGVLYIRKHPNGEKK